MAVAYQFNRIEIQNLRKQLKTRLTALPTLKSKESVLRNAVQKQKEALEELETGYNAKKQALEATYKLWPEFPTDLLAIESVDLGLEKIAGVPVPVLKELRWKTRDFSRFNKPAWLPVGVSLLKDLGRITVLLSVTKQVLGVLETARRKTTQKVNLYEKVQIPEYNAAILHIKRYLEDVENLEKAAQKLTKDRMDAANAGGAP